MRMLCDCGLILQNRWRLRLRLPGALSSTAVDGCFSGTCSAYALQALGSEVNGQDVWGAAHTLPFGNAYLAICYFFPELIPRKLTDTHPQSFGMY